MWQNKLVALCQSMNIEPILDNGRLIIVCPKLIKDEDRTRVADVIPTEYTVQWELGPKPSTIAGVKAQMMAAGVMNAQVCVDNGDLLIDAQAMQEVDGQTWEVINKFIYNDGFFKSWKIELNKQLIAYCNRDVVREQQTRQAQYKTITENDIQNLKINLETMDVNEFLETL